MRPEQVIVSLNGDRCICDESTLFVSGDPAFNPQLTARASRAGEGSSIREGAGINGWVLQCLVAAPLPYASIFPFQPQVVARRAA